MWIICTVRPYIKKIATLPIIIHISSPAILVERRSKHIAPTHCKRHIAPYPNTRPNFSFEEQSKAKHSHRSVTHILVQPFVVCVLARLLQVRPIERKTPDSSRFVCKSELCRKRPNYRISVVQCRNDLDPSLSVNVLEHTLKACQRPSAWDQLVPCGDLEDRG